MDAVVAGLAGTFIGSAGSLAVVWIQSHYQARRDQAKAVLEFSTQSRAQDINLAVSRGTRNQIAPISAYVHHHQAIFEMLKENDVGEERVAKVFSESRRIKMRLTDMDSRWAVDEAISKSAGDDQ